MTGLLHRHILLPAFDALKGRKTFAYFRDLERSQWKSRPALEDDQFRALRDIVAHGFAHCPYYSEQWRELGLTPELLKAPEDLRRWPVIDRETIREHRQGMRAALPGLRLLGKTTGGSSGVPLAFDIDAESNERRTAASYRGYAWAGAAPGTRQLYLWGTAVGGQTLRRRLKDALYHQLHNRHMLSCFELTEDRTEHFLRRINAHRPQSIVAYTSAVYSLARCLEERKLEPYSPRSIVVGAEKLHPFQREIIERVFRAPVFETYGSREFMLIGAECERHAGLHLTTESLLVEVLDDDGRPTAAGEEGNVVVTDLFNYGMPFVRYANGDRAVAGFTDCPCGRGLPLLRQVTGRRLDVIKSPDGRLLPGEFFPHLIKDFPAVRRFQVVQERPDELQIRLVAPELRAEDQTRLESLVREAIGARMRLVVSPVPDIPLTRVGKLQVVINRVQREAA